MSTAPRTVSELEIAAFHVCYELNSMVDMTLLLNRGPTDGTIRNALLEGMLIHARNLIDFLGPWKPQKDDIVPGDFVAGWSPDQLEVSDIERTLIHKHLAHLTWTRVNEGKVAWEFPGIVAVVFEAIRKFVEHCEAESAALAGMFRLNFDLAQARIKAAMGVPSDVSLTTGSTNDALVLGDFRESTPEEGGIT